MKEKGLKLKRQKVKDVRQIFIYIYMYIWKKKIYIYERKNIYMKEKNIYERKRSQTKRARSKRCQVKKVYTYIYMKEKNIYMREKKYIYMKEKNIYIWEKKKIYMKEKNIHIYERKRSQTKNARSKRCQAIYIYMIEKIYIVCIHNDFCLTSFTSCLFSLRPFPFIRSVKVRIT